MNKLSTNITVHEPRIAKKIAGFTSFVCRFVSPVHRWASAVCSGEYEAVALIFLGASFGVLRSLDSGFSSAENLSIKAAHGAM
jgi:hypothetical protein